LRQVLGGKRYEYLLGLLAFIRTAHYWTVTHPQLAPEEDVESYLRLNEELTRLLLEDPEAARCDMGSRLFAELEDLRDLNERRELESLVAQKELLLREVNHRVKNSLQIVSSILHLQTKAVSAEAAAEMRTASARILAIAAVHERLYTGGSVTTVTLDAFLRDLCADIGKALRRATDLEIELVAVEVPTDKAVPLALIVNELVTNAIKYGKPPCRVETRKGIHDTLTLTVSDRGNGPAQNHKRGLGSRIVDAFVQQLAAKVTTIRNADRYAVEIEIPIGAPSPRDEGAESRG
jgi:two-component sensor histidine kinase